LNFTFAGIKKKSRIVQEGKRNVRRGRREKIRIVRQVKNRHDPPTKNVRCPRIFLWTSFACCCMKVEIWMKALLRNTEGNIPYLFDMGAKIFLMVEDGGR
jgi:hypothetical protein